jgi:hypothetical protein
MFHKMDDSFRVGIRLELYAFRDQFIFQLEKIFDDAVLHDNNSFRLTDVGMRVARVRRAMRCPARVPDSRRALDRRFADQINQLR